MDDKMYMLRHMLAAIAYRLQKALRDFPAGFDSFRAGPGARTPHQIIFHITSVLGYARTFFIGGEWCPEICKNLQLEMERLHDILNDLKDHIESDTPLQNLTPEQMLQGQLSDAMTHIGQIAMLRRLFGSAIPPENFIRANINGENVGPNQADPASPDKNWRDAEGNPENTS